jgi:hypothetical protein
MGNPFEDCKTEAEKYFIGDDGYERAATAFLASIGALLSFAKASGDDCAGHTKKFMLAAIKGAGDNIGTPFGIDDFIGLFGD